jgi:hypothetical protein
MNLKKLGIVLFLCMCLVGFSVPAVFADGYYTVHNGDGNVLDIFLRVYERLPNGKEEMTYISENQYPLYKQTKTITIPQDVIKHSSHTDFVVKCGDLWSDTLTINNWRGPEVRDDTHYLGGWSVPWKNFRTKWTYKGATYESGSNKMRTHITIDG